MFRAGIGKGRTSDNSPRTLYKRMTGTSFPR